MFRSLEQGEGPAMLERFMAQVAHPLPSSALPPNRLLQTGITSTGLTRLTRDLHTLKATDRAPSGLPVDARFLLIHGSADAVVTPEAHQDLVDELKIAASALRTFSPGRTWGMPDHTRGPEHRDRVAEHRSVTNAWSKRVLDDFGRKAATYNHGVPLQRAVAERLAEHIRRAAVPHGLWVDLGSGSGLLANAIVRRHPGQSVLRVDGSAAMLEQQPAGVETLLQDLEHGLPVLTQPPLLLASSFCLHWLGTLWVSCSAGGSTRAGGVLALAVPVAGSFPQWHQAAGAAGFPAQRCRSRIQISCCRPWDRTPCCSISGCRSHSKGRSLRYCCEGSLPSARMPPSSPL